VKSFIGNICTEQFIGDLDCNDPLPPPPFPPDDPDNPNHFYTAADDGVASISYQFMPGHNGIMVRQYGRRGAASNFTLSALVTQAGVTTVMDTIVLSSYGGVDSSYCFASIAEVTPDVQATLTFTVEGIAGRAWTRVGDFGHLPDDAKDTALFWENLSGNGSTDNYYCEIVPNAPSGALMLSVVGWLDAGANPITSSGDWEQWKAGEGVGAAGSAVYFGSIDSDLGGEPGWGGYVWYSNMDNTRRPNAVLIAIPGATLPSAP